MTSYVDQQPDKVRKNPLGPVTLNRLQANIRAVDELVLREHFNDGQHNALEVPWILGAIDNSTTGYLFDTTFGGGSIARPATGRVTLNAVAGVVGDVDYVDGSGPAASIIANVNDAAIATYPHVVEAELVSATSIELRTRYMISTLGSPGNSWSPVAVGVDVAVHAQQQPFDASLLGSNLVKVRRDFLTDPATDWNALVRNQGHVTKALALEHLVDGQHSVDRIAKARGWFRPISGPDYEIVLEHGVASVSRVSAGVIEVTLDGTLSSTSLAACFPQAQPANADELVIIHGRCTTTKKFRFYIYAYSVAEDQWDRADRSFSAAMFGRLA